MKATGDESFQSPGEFRLEDALRIGKSKRQVLEIAAWVGGDRRRFGKLVGLMKGPDSKLANRAAWVAGSCVDVRPGLLKPHLGELLDLLERPGLHAAIPRNTFRMLQNAPISGDLEGRVLSAALAALGGAVPVAVKANAMTVLKRLAAEIPEILAEVRLLIDEQSHDASPAFRIRARREFGGRSGRM